MNIVPKFSVVIPLYNKSSEIISTLQSVLQQSHRAAEILVINDGSTDDSAELMEDYINENNLSGYVILVNKKNAGVSAARNTGIDHAKHEYIAFIDADDIWEKHFLEEIAMLTRTFPKAETFSTGYQKVIDKNVYVDAKIRGLHSEKPAILNNYFEICSKGDLPFISSSVCIRKSLLARIGAFPLGEPIGEDQDLWSRIALKSTIAHSPRVLAYYHLEASNRACNLNIPEQECPFSQRLYQYTLDTVLPKKMNNNILRYTATHLLHLARLNVMAGKLEAAEKLLSDQRCRLLRLKYWVCRVRLLKAQLSH